MTEPICGNGYYYNPDYNLCINDEAEWFMKATMDHAAGYEFLDEFEISSSAEARDEIQQLFNTAASVTDEPILEGGLDTLTLSPAEARLAAAMLTNEAGGERLITASEASDANEQLQGLIGTSVKNWPLYYSRSFEPAQQEQLLIEDSITSLTVCFVYPFYASDAKEKTHYNNNQSDLSGEFFDLAAKAIYGVHFSIAVGAKLDLAPVNALVRSAVHLNSFREVECPDDEGKSHLGRCFSLYDMDFGITFDMLQSFREVVAAMGDCYGIYTYVQPRYQESGADKYGNCFNPSYEGDYSYEVNPGYYEDENYDDDYFYEDNAK